MPSAQISPELTRPPEEISTPPRPRPPAESVILEAVLPHFSGYHHVVRGEAEAFAARLAAALRALGLIDR